MHFLRTQKRRRRHAVHAAKAAVDQRSRSAEVPRELRNRQPPLRVLKQVRADLLGELHLRQRITVLRLRRLNGKRTQKQQQLQNLHLEIALADALRHRVELRENVRHARRRARDKAGTVRTEFFDERTRPHLDILQKARQAVRRARRVDRHRDAVVVPGRKAHRDCFCRALHDRQIARREKKAGIAIWVSDAPLAAVMDLETAGRTRTLRGGACRMDVVIRDLDSRENRVSRPCRFPV